MVLNSQCCPSKGRKLTRPLIVGTKTLFYCRASYTHPSEASYKPPSPNVIVISDSSSLTPFLHPLHTSSMLAAGVAYPTSVAPPLSSSLTTFAAKAAAAATATVPLVTYDAFSKLIRSVANIKCSLMTEHMGHV